MGFEKTESAKLYTAIDGDTLQTIAERETAEGNPITWQELAKYNWGTDDQATINELLRDELGARKRDAANNFVISPDDTPRSELRIPKKFEKKTLSLEKTHIFRVRKKEICPQFQACSSIPGATFETDKSFLRPSVVDSIESIENAILENPGAKIMIFGHTDKVGSDSYNKALSERRAKSVYAFITDDAQTWEDLYKEEDWGTKAIQEILKDFDDPAFDPGPVDGIYGQKTREAVRNFQEARGLSVDGIAGPQTRKQLFSDYMTGKHDVKVTQEQFMEPKYMGCGEFNPVDPTEEATEVNRRVVFLLFHPDRIPNLPCVSGESSSCSRQSIADQPRHHEGFRCSFYDSLACRCPVEAKYEVKALRIFGRPTLYNDRPEEATNIIIPKDWEVTLHWEVENAEEVVIEARYIDRADNVELIPMPNGGRTPTSVGKCVGEVTHRPASDVVYWLSAYNDDKYSDYYGAVKIIHLPAAAANSKSTILADEPYMTVSIVR